MNLNKLFSAMLFSSLLFSGYSQCDPAANTLSYTNYFDCTNNGDNIVSTFENIQLNVTGGGGTYTWYDNGVSFYTSSTYPANQTKVYQFTTPGAHTIILEINRAGCPLITKTLAFNVVLRECPATTITIANNSLCAYPEDSMLVTIGLLEQTAVIQGSTWNMSDGTILNNSGSTFYFKPSEPSLITGTGYVNLQLPDMSTCVSQICDKAFGIYYYSDPQFQVEGSLLTGQPLDIVFKGSAIYPDYSVGNHQYKLYVNGVLTGTYNNLLYNQIITTIASPANGVYSIKLTGEFTRDHCLDEMVQEVTVTSSDIVSDPEACLNCNTFIPRVGEKYWVSAWVKENQPSQVMTYANSSVQIDFVGSGTVYTFTPTGDIIDGWQRIVGSFIIPSGTTDVKINLVNSQSLTIDNYFDDVRIHPFNGSMKSYVYDPVTYWLTAELDDNNYATFYEYDKEGQLIRIKKETARGIMTIQETRSNNPKL